MATRGELLSAICNLVSDYRVGEIPTIDSAHVDRWVGQFSDEVQLPMLWELQHLLSRSYLSQRSFDNFLNSLVIPSPFAGQDPTNFWRETGILNIQTRGTSQKEMLARFDPILQRACGISIAECASAQGRYLYLDDALFSGFHAIKDLSAWLQIAPATSRVIVLSLAIHSGSISWIRRQVTAAARILGKNVTIEFYRAFELENQPGNRDRSDVFWPARLPNDPLVAAYVQELVNAGYAPILRIPSASGQHRFFSSESARDMLEQDFLKAGARIRSICPNLHDYQRPLGNHVLNTLGFGSLVVTYRNCPNNNPLALWVADPWYPLYPRRTN